jgi:hypothetical protein
MHTRQFVWCTVVCFLLWLVACSGTRTPANAPTGVDVAVEANAITITWQDNSEEETGFAVDRKSDADFSELVRLEPNTTTYTDTTATAGQSYVYRVRALGLPTGDVPSTESEAVTPEAAPEITLELLFAQNSTGSGSITSSPEGINCTLQTGSVCRASFPAGTAITLTATPVENSSFASWDGCEASAPVCQLVLTENKTIQVRFVPEQNTLTVQKDGDGRGRVTSGTPPDIDCGDACLASYAGEVIFRLRAAAEPGSSFAGWSDNCKLVGSLCEVSIGNGKGATVTATFTKVAPPVISAFSVDKSVVTVGSSVVFSWTVTGENIQSLVLKDDSSATPDIPVTGKTSHTLDNLQRSATYTLLATNAGGSTTSQGVSVRVGTAPTLANFVATPNEDGSFRLSWEASGSAPLRYKLFDGSSELSPAPTSSPYDVRPAAFPALYSLEASNDFGAATPLTVTIQAPVPARIVTFAVVPDALVFPGPVRVTWSVQGDAPLTLTLERDDTDETITLTELTGSLQLEVTETTRFTLTAQNASGDDEEEVRVRVR